MNGLRFAAFWTLNLIRINPAKTIAIIVLIATAPFLNSIPDAVEYKRIDYRYEKDGRDFYVTVDVDSHKESYEVVPYDKARLAKDILEGHDCYVGMRDLEEFKAAKDLFDAIIWVDASKRLGTSEYTNKIPVSEADMVITNDGSFEDFKEKARLLGNMLFDKETDKRLFKNSKMHW